VKTTPKSLACAATFFLCIGSSAFAQTSDIATELFVAPTSVEQGEVVEFGFEFSVLEGHFTSSDQLIVVNTLPKGFRPLDLPRFTEGDWNCAITARPTRTMGRILTCSSREGIAEMPMLRFAVTAPSNHSGDFTNCAMVTVVRQGETLTSRGDEGVAVCIDVAVLDLPPEPCRFQIEASADDAFLSAGDVIGYSIDFRNVGGTACDRLSFQMYDSAVDIQTWQITTWNLESQSRLQKSPQAEDWGYGQSLLPYMGNGHWGARDLVWTPTDTTFSAGGLPPGESTTFSSQEREPIPDFIVEGAGGFMSCVLAAQDVSEYAVLGPLVEAQIDPNRPNNQDWQSGYVEWASNINSDLASAGVSNAQCIGWDMLP